MFHGFRSLEDLRILPTFNWQKQTPCFQHCFLSVVQFLGLMKALGVSSAISRMEEIILYMELRVRVFCSFGFYVRFGVPIPFCV